MTPGRFELAGFVIALLAAAAGAIFMIQAANDPSGTVDGSPPQAFTLFLTVGTFAAAGDLNLLLRGSITGPARIARHLWRMCTGTFIAAGSFFLGQQQLFPKEVQNSSLLFVPVLLPLVVLAFWMLRVRLTNWYRQAPAN